MCIEMRPKSQGAAYNRDSMVLAFKFDTEVACRQVPSVQCCMGREFLVPYSLLS